MNNRSIIYPDILIAEALECSHREIIEGLALGLHPKWDSLAHLRVMMALEKNYGVDINDDSIKQFHTRDAIHQRYAEIL